jgi:hypothetical protein
MSNILQENSEDSILDSENFKSSLYRIGLLVDPQYQPGGKQAFFPPAILSCRQNAHPLFSFNNEEYNYYRSKGTVRRRYADKGGLP